MYLLTQVVTLALKFVPQLAPVAGVLNRVVAPAVHVAWQNAEQRAARGIAALHGVAAAVKDIRAKYDEQTAEDIIGHLDKGLDADHKETVAAIVNGR